jgi:hypothetical protein
VARAHRGLHPRVHHSGSGFRCVQAFGWDRPGGAWIWAVGALVRPADAGVRPPDALVRPADAGVRPPDALVRPADAGVWTADAEVRPPDAGIRPADARVRPADAGVWPVDTRIRSAGLACPPSPVGLGGSLTHWSNRQSQGNNEQSWAPAHPSAGHQSQPESVSGQRSCATRSHRAATPAGSPRFHAVSGAMAQAERIPCANQHCWGVHIVAWRERGVWTVEIFTDRPRRARSWLRQPGVHGEFTNFRRGRKNRL